MYTNDGGNENTLVIQIKDLKQQLKDLQTEYKQKKNEFKTKELQLNKKLEEANSLLTNSTHMKEVLAKGGMSGLDFNSLPSLPIQTRYKFAYCFALINSNDGLLAQMVVLLQSIVDTKTNADLVLMYYNCPKSHLDFLRENFGTRLKLKESNDNKLVKGPWIDFTPGTWKFAWYKLHAWKLTEYEMVSFFFIVVCFFTEIIFLLEKKFL